MADHRLSQVSTASSTNSKRARAHIGPWQLGRTLGRGSSGRVRLAKHAETGKLAAVKIVPKAQIHDPQAPGEKDSYGIEREVIIMKLIEHPNVMALYDVWENKGELYLVLEYIEGGELFDYLISRGRLSEREAIHYFRQICYGVAYCHRFNICHRDLKPENLLLDKSRNIKIADFGMAALETNGRLLETSCGSPHYASPEIVTGKTYHGAPSDIWSCGIILFALLTGHLPFDDDNIRQLLLKVQSGKYVMPHSLSVEARDLIARMLVVDPVERITMNEILSHPLLQKYPARHVPPENMGARMPSVDIAQPIATIDREILRNLQTLWHRDSREVLTARLRAPGPNVEKTFYSLLLRFRQKHGLANRGVTGQAMPWNRSVASIRSLRSTRSIRSLQSARSGRSPSARSVRSQRSTLTSRSTRSVRSALSTQPQRHRAGASKRVSPRKNAATAAAAGRGSRPSSRPTSIEPRSDIHADTFAQLLDQAFNPSLPASQPAQSRVVSSPVPPSNYSSLAAPAASQRVVSDPVKPLAPLSETQQRRRSPYEIDLLLSNDPLLSAHTSSETHTLADSPELAQLGAHHTQQPQQPQQPQQRQPPPSQQQQQFSQAQSQPSLQVPPPQLQPQLQPTSDDPQNYLPMIFEEDRFADAIEEEMELKLYKQGKLTRPRLVTADSTAGSSSSGSQPGDNSQLQITNLVAGESFFSYKPSAAAAAVSPPVRPAPRAPNGPRELPSVSQRKPVPIYTDDAAPAVASAPTAATKRQSPTRKPLTPIMSHEVRGSQARRDASAAVPQTAAGAAAASQPPPQDEIKIPKKGDVPKEKKKSWIRRLTPRLASRGKRDAAVDTEPEKPAAAAVAPPRAPLTRGEAPRQRRDERASTTHEAARAARARRDADANKENTLPRTKTAPAPMTQTRTATQTKTPASAAARQKPAAPARATATAEEPKQNWFMKLLSSPQSSRTLMCTCQPIELRAMVLEILSDWMPHGLALYNNGARGEPIVVAIMRTNSLRLKAARIGIAVGKGHTGTASSARLYLQRGSRTSFMAFTNEMERRLGALGVLGLAE